MIPELVDAFNELEDVKAECALLRGALDLMSRQAESIRDELEWLTIQGVASAIEKIYSGIERCLQSIARYVDELPVAKDEAWHRALITRMENPFNEVRPAVLSAAALEALNSLRSFRHFARNSYGSRLDKTRVLELAEAAMSLPRLIEADLQNLSTYLSQKRS